MPSNNFKVGEMLNMRSEYSKTWINFDGSFTTEIHGGPVHYVDENGNLQNINTDLYDEADFDQIDFPVAKDGDSLFYEAREKVKEDKKKNRLDRDRFDFQGLKVPFDCKIPSNIKRGYSIGKGLSKLNFIPVGASTSKGYVEGNKITYQDVWNDADLVLEVLTTGIKETIILKSERAPFDFSFEVEGELSEELKIQPPWLQDANGEKRDVLQGVSETDGKTILSLAADVTGLVYPIEIDPTVTIQPTDSSGEDAMVWQGSPSTNYANGGLTAGYDGNYWYESFFKFNLTGITGIVTSATVTLEQASRTTGDNSIRQFVLSRVTQSWTETGVTYNTKPSKFFDNNAPTADPIVNIDLSGALAPRSWNVIHIVKQWIEQGQPNYGFNLWCGSYNPGYANYVDFNAFENGTVSSRPKLVITYNAPPSAPTVTAPNGGEAWNSSHTVTWSPSTDDATAQASLQYHIQLTTNNGSTWSDIVALTTAGATSYTFDFINKPESSTCKIRIRSYDGSTYGPWDESNGVFTIAHNLAPSTPTNLSPIGTVKDRAQITRLSWQHNDANADPQAKFDLQWRLQGTPTWNTVTQTTINQYWDAPVNTFPKGIIEWQVRTYDQAGLSSPYSALTTFATGDKPANPTITSPAGGSTVAVANPTVQWSSVGQTDYHLKVLNTSNTLLWESVKNSTNKAETILYNLQNSTSYKIQLAIKNADGLWSDFVTVNISVSYTPPAIPDIDLKKGDSYIEINILDKVPSGTQPAVLYHEIYKEVDSEFVLIATNVSTKFRDYHIASGEIVRYYVRTIGNNNTFSDTITFSETVSFKGVWLHIVDNPQETIRQFKFDGDGRSSKWGLESAVHMFQGRKNPVIETGIMEEYMVDFALKMVDSEERDALNRITMGGQTVCYRDGRGRKVFGVFVDVPLSDEKWGGYSTSLSLLKIDFKEGIE
jgi:hypothetical protein